ncbi:DUF4377 domain-containing protein [Polyangium sp. y55x31]|uniref:DUF4377 domain-containing protein n=1 Tax=Polyangium sp. y55x31 TaxID=3042688 RepID=UPI0024826F61|nr:DUF4377 domain-containing protein [Polyangium sp. y55x31]MDI1475256.1 DUF4377 domain-containing protein [Polyangium sp. y55x31]
MRSLLSFLVPLTLVACSGSDSGGSGGSGGSDGSSNPPSTKILEIEHYRDTCVGEGRFLCLLTREEGQADFQFHYGDITGFAPEWGHRYTIEIEEKTIPNPPADGSSIELVLVRIVSDEVVPASTTFVVHVDGSADELGYGSDLTFDASGGGKLRDQVPFTCGTQAACDAAAQVEIDKKQADVTFGYSDPVGLPLVLLEVMPK